MIDCFHESHQDGFGIQCLVFIGEGRKRRKHNLAFMIELLQSTENVSKVSNEHGASLSCPAAYLMVGKILASIWPAMILFGLVSNVINIVVFLKLGKKDNVIILLLSLAVSDFVFFNLLTPSICGYIIWTTNFSLMTI